MSLIVRWGGVCLAAALLSGCSLFRRDLKDASDSAQISKPSVVEERVAGGGPTAGETGLERATEQTFEWSEEDNKAASPGPSPASSPSTLPPRIEDTRPGSGLESAQASPLTPKRAPLETELPGAAPVPPEPTGKPVTASALSGVGGIGQPPITAESQEDPRAALASRPPRPDTLVGTNPLLPAGGMDEGSRGSGAPSAGGLTLRSPPALASPPTQTLMADSGVPKGGVLIPPTERAGNLEGASGDLSRAVRSSGLSVNRSDPWHGPSKGIPGGPGPTPPSIPPSQTVSSPGTGLETSSSSFIAADPRGSSILQPPVEKPAGAPVGRPFSEPLPDPKTLKAQGVQQYRDKQFEAAILTFRKYLSAYPDEDQEIRWRLANSLLLSKRWGEASKEFNVLRGSQRPEFVADAILKLGKIDQIKGDLPGAKLNWKRVVEKYPNTDAAEEAAKLLAENP